MTTQPRAQPMTSEQKRRKLMRRAVTTATDKYNGGGQVKEGRHVPRPITLATTPWKDDEQ